MAALREEHGGADAVAHEAAHLGLADLLARGRAPGEAVDQVGAVEQQLLLGQARADAHSQAAAKGKGDAGLAAGEVEEGVVEEVLEVEVRGVLDVLGREAESVHAPGHEAPGRHLVAVVRDVHDRLAHAKDAEAGVALDLLERGPKVGQVGQVRRLHQAVAHGVVNLLLHLGQGLGVVGHVVHVLLQPRADRVRAGRQRVDNLPADVQLHEVALVDLDQHRVDNVARLGVGVGLRPLAVLGDNDADDLVNHGVQLVGIAAQRVDFPSILEVYVVPGPLPLTSASYL